MSKGQQQRERIFQVYSAHLNVLLDAGIIDSACAPRDCYICPLCLQQFASVDSTDNPLTLEHAPPGALGGKAHVLTCAKCNNDAGKDIDSHLVARLREIDSLSFAPGSETKVRVKIGNVTVQGTIKATENGAIQMHHSYKNNHPAQLQEGMKALAAGMIITPDFIRTKVIPEHLEYALVKTAYLIAFRKYGYSFLLHECFNIFREQIRNPEARIIPNGFWFTPPYPKEMEGAYFVCNEGLESLMVIFAVNSGITERTFGVTLPLPIHPLEMVLDRIHRTFSERDGEFYLSLYPLEQGDTDFLHKVENITAMREWIEKRAG